MTEVPKADSLVEVESTQRDRDAVRPFGPIHFVPGHGGWWAECPKTGFGFWYPTLRAAVRRYLVRIVSVHEVRGSVCYVGEP